MPIEDITEEHDGQRVSTKGTVEVPVDISNTGEVSQAGQPGLRQRLKVKLDDVSKGVEEMSVKLKRKVSRCTQEAMVCIDVRVTVAIRYVHDSRRCCV
jgi:hypothetical protein